MQIEREVGSHAMRDTDEEHRSCGKQQPECSYRCSEPQTGRRQASARRHWHVRGPRRGGLSHPEEISGFITRQYA